MLKGFKNSPELDFSIPENKEAMLKAFEQVDKEKGQDYPLIIGGERIMTDKKMFLSRHQRKKSSDRSVPVIRSLQIKRFRQHIKHFRHGAELLPRNGSAVFADWWTS